MKDKAKKLVAQQHPRMKFYGASVAERSSEGSLTTAVEGKRDYYEAVEEGLLDKGTLFLINSVTKPFTAAAMLKLMEDSQDPEQGHLESSHFPDGVHTKVSHFDSMIDLPDGKLREIFGGDYENVTLLDLMHHTSGLGQEGTADQAQLAVIDARLEKTPEDRSTWQPSDIVSASRKTGPYGEHQYSNANYELLGMIASAVYTKQSGDSRTVHDVIRDKVIAPMGLEHTLTSECRDDLERGNEPNLANGYLLTADEQVVDAVHGVWGNASGGMLSTPSDLTAFAQRAWGSDPGSSLFSDERTRALLHDEALMVERPDGAKYGLGLVLYKDGEVGHDGWCPAGNSDLRYNPKTGVATAYTRCSESVTCSPGDKAMPEQRPRLSFSERQLSALALDALDPALKRASELMQMKEGDGVEQPALAVEKLQSQPPKGSREV